MNARWNLFAGVASSAWGALLALIVVPVYLRHLGLAGYGLVGLLGTLQALFSLLDAGLAPAMNREVARGFASGSLDAVRSLLHTLATIYWLVAAVIAVASIALAPVFAEYWFRDSELGQSALLHALLLIVWVIAARWPSALYLGVLLGAQRVVLSSAIAAGFATLTSLGCVVIVVFVTSNIEVFFGWQVAVGLGNALVLRWAAWSAIGKRGALSFSWPAIRTIWRFSVGMTGIALSAILLTQVDKVILSRMLPLSDLGRYSIATLAVSGLYLLTVPTFNVVYPRLTAIVSGGTEESFVGVYRHWSRLYSLVMFPCAMLLAVFAGDLLHLWTGNAELSVAIAPVVSLLAVGAALHGAMYFPYALALAHGDTRLPFGINVTLLVIAIPLMSLLTWRLGIYGAGLAGLLLYSTYFLVGSWATHRKLARSIVALWRARDILPSMGACFVTGSIGSWLVRRSDFGATASVLLAALMTLAAWGLALLLMPRGVPAQLRATLAIRGR